jgi:hypothetical protein
MLPVSEASATQLDAITRGAVVQWGKDVATLYGDCASRVITAREGWPR